MKLTPIRHLALDQPSASGHFHISAASGLVVLGRNLFVVGDDETHLAVFQAGSEAPGRLVRLFDDRLPREPRLRKAAKPDLEILLSLPPAPDHPHGALLALGSGSTSRRQRGALIVMDQSAQVESVRPLDLSMLVRSLSSSLAETNIEGAIVRDEQLLLFNRGNKSHPEAVVIAVRLVCVTQSRPGEFLWRKTLELGSADGVPYTITDASAEDSGKIVISAVAEDTTSAYADGRTVGAMFGVLGADLDLIRTEAVDPLVKIEGVHAWRDGKTIRMLAVSDADNPASAATLFEGAIEAI